VGFDYEYYNLLHATAVMHANLPQQLHIIIGLLHRIGHMSVTVLYGVICPGISLFDTLEAGFISLLL
jgi:hypothetical protein